jgi:phage host-nuclease inhibitor protein Gam
MSSVPPVSGNISVSQFISILSAGGVANGTFNDALMVDGNLNLSVLSVLGGLSSTNSSNSAISLMQLYLGSVAAYSLLMTQVNQVANQIALDQAAINADNAAIAADQAIINDPHSTSQQKTDAQNDITAKQNDIVAKQTNLAVQEATLFFLGILAASGSTQSMVRRIGDTTLPARALPQLIGANNLTITLPKDPGSIIQEFVAQLQLTSSFSDPSKLAELTATYLSVFEKLTADIQLIGSVTTSLDQLDPSAPDYAAQASQYNAQIASLRQNVTLLQSELFALSVEFVLPAPTVTPAVTSAPGTAQEDVGFREQIRGVSAKLNSDLAAIQAAQAAVVKLDPTATDYTTQVSEYAKQIAALSSDLSVQQGQVLALAIRVQSADLSTQNPDLVGAREELLAELGFLASGSTISSNDLRPASV